MLTDFAIAKEAGVRTALVKESPHIQANNVLTLECVPKGAEVNAKTARIISALEICEEGFTPQMVTNK